MALTESFSGIRGIYGKELTDELAVRYAYAFSQQIKEKKPNPKIVLGMDTRISGESLRKAVIEGLDCDITDAGILPTAAIELAVRQYKADGGIIITASHNEPEYNGFKFLGKDGSVLKSKDIERVIETFHKLKSMKEEDFLSNHLYKKSQMRHVKIILRAESDALQKYKKFILSFLDKKEKEMLRNSKIIIDPNGGTGMHAKEIFDELGIKAKYINMEKGVFKRKIEPNEDSLEYLTKEIKKNKSDFAAGFDCDADRVEIILRDGSLVSGSQILALVADDVLSGLKHPEEETIVVNDATSYLVKEIVQGHGAKWREVEVGEINVVHAMIDFNSPVGGEGSNGGIIIPPSTCRDGILTLLFLLKIIAKKKKSLKELVEELPEYYYLKEKIALKKDFPKIREKLKKYYLDNGFTVEETGDDTGGLKAIKSNAWIWFRQSKTEDKVLRIIADSKDEKMAEELVKEAIRILKR